MARFDVERRERWLSLVESGHTQAEACQDVGVSPTTVARWRANGAAGKNPEAVSFAKRLDAVVNGCSEASLSEADLVRLMEGAARKGSVRAIKLLMDRLAGQDVIREAERIARADAERNSFWDELDARRNAPKRIDADE